MLDKLIFPVFQAMRNHGIALGTDDYMIAVRALRSGVHIESPSRLRRLLKLLWAKSRDDCTFLDEVFERKVAPYLKDGNSISREYSDQISENFEPQDNSKIQKKWVSMNLEQRAWRKASERAIARLDPRPIEATTEAIRKFRLNPKPELEKRDAIRVFQRLRQPIIISESNIPDFDATIRGICKNGFFSRLVHAWWKINRTKLAVFVDQGGSMVPFSIGVEPLLKALKSEVDLRDISFFYFHDCPTPILYKSPGINDPISINTFLKQQAIGLNILVISDAGAARGDYDRRRVSETRVFVDKIRRLTMRIAWINPVPHERWIMSTAKDIEKIVPMFYMDRVGLEGAVRSLRGVN